MIPIMIIDKARNSVIVEVSSEEMQNLMDGKLDKAKMNRTKSNLMKELNNFINKRCKRK